MTNILSFVGGALVGGILAALVLSNKNKAVVNTPKTKVEIFKGELTKTAITDTARKIFSYNENVKEIVLVGDVEKCDLEFKNSILNQVSADVQCAEGFKANFLIAFANDGKIHSICQIVTESVEPVLQQLIDDNNQLVRIAR